MLCAKPDYKPLRCSYWNINGHRSKILGDKLIDPKFLQMISESDILGLAEIHSEEKVFVPGFKLIKQKIWEKKFKGPKVAGGLAIFVREELVPFVQVIPNTKENSIWIKLGKKSRCEKEEIFIGTFYVSPPSKNQKAQNIDFFTEFNEEINIFNSRGIVLVQGNLNARTGQDKDYIEYDKFDQHFVQNLNNQHTRNSEDLTINPRGKELLDVCKLNDILIMNGRKIGDLFGKFTSHQWNGSSVVDYAITSNEFSKNVLEFAVGEFVPWISDHCPIHTKFNLDWIGAGRKTTTNKLTDIPPQFIWDIISKERYTENLKSNDIGERINLLVNSDNINSIDIAKEITDILMKNARTCGIKTKSKMKECKLRQNAYQSGPWFDKECMSIKNQISIEGNILKQNPSNQYSRTTLFQLKRVFRKMVKRKKRAHKQEILNQMTTKKEEKNQKEFWKLLEKFKSKNIVDSTNVSPLSFVEHFKSILTSNTATNTHPENNEVGPLDYEIDMEELKSASSILKPGKAVGADNLSNEMISSLVETHPKLILKLFNSILTTSEVVPEWLMGLIVPIYKKGDKSDPSNYRGITLMSCLGKLFLSILNNRLMKFTIENNILHKSQLGFVPGNRTSDAHIIINNLIQKYCFKTNSKIFSCFVDFSKAFDSIPRDILLNKLLSHNIKGKFFNIIRNIYMNDTSRIKIQNQCTETFEISKGVRQGCVLSPLLFNIFLSDLVKNLSLKEGKVKIADTEIASIVWADDIVLLAENEGGLQQMLNVLDAYCQENKLDINTAKTKCMTFNKSGRLIRRNFHVNGVILENVRSYKYLGFLLTPSGEIRTGLKDLRDRALKAFMKLRNTLGTAFNKNVLTTISLIQALINPILLFNSDFWGCLKLPKANPIDNLDMMMCKQLLGVQKQTTNIGVLLELGRVPLQLFAVKLAIKNWERIRHGKANALLMASYVDATKENSQWISTIKEYLEKNGMLNLFINPYKNKPPFIHKKLYKTLTDSFHQNSFETINNDNSKLRTYSIFKQEIGFEKYLSNVKNPSKRAMLTKFRLSNHKLMIEVGRHMKIPKEVRFCPFCPSIVETEAHFLFSCPIYHTLRVGMMDYYKNLNCNFQYYSERQKVYYLLSELEHPTIDFIINSLELRDFLMAKHKRLS